MAAATKPPIEILQAFETLFEESTAEQGQVEIGRRSVTVVFEKTYYPEDHEGKVLSIDAVPAFECSGGDYEIPDKVTGTWIKTNPEKHKEQATAKNEEFDGHWVPLVKMVKGWNRANGKPLSRHSLIEVMAEELVESPFSTYPDEMRNFFAAMEANIGRTWPDPAGLGPPVSDQMTPERITEQERRCRKRSVRHLGAPGRGDRAAGRSVGNLARGVRRLFPLVVGVHWRQYEQLVAIGASVRAS